MSNQFQHLWRDYFTLCKPRVVLLMLFTAWIGMYLASHGTIDIGLWFLASLGIFCLSSAAATANHVFEKNSDALMVRTAARPIASGRINPKHAWIFSLIMAIAGFLILFYGVNSTIALLTLLTGLGYAVCYTLYLKPTTPQNIVLGGLFGAMPPLLGWTAITGHVDPQGLLLVLLIFVWTPAHFWALALYRHQDYLKTKNKIPMLPATHGIAYTKFNVLLYSLLTVAVSSLIYACHLCNNIYLVCATGLNIVLLYYAVRLYRTPDQTIFLQQTKITLKTFFFSMLYLFLLFLSMALDRFYLLNGT